MIKPSLAEFLSAVKAELGRGLPGLAGKSLVTVKFLADTDSGGGVALRPVVTTDAERPEGQEAHCLVIEIPGVGVVGSPVTSMPSGPSLPRVHAPMESANPVLANRQTLRRRLELVLGGPPGFNTGAKAEMLADLLEEFGRAELLETIRRDWITQFDTGIELSTSVTKAPGKRD